MPEDRPEAAPQAATTDVEAASRQYLFFRRLAVATLILSSATALSLNLVDPDLWGHVLYGEELLTEGRLPRTATHTFTATDFRWINHENLAEIVLAVGFRYLGTSGMLALKCLWGVGILGLMVWSARRRGVDPLAAWAVALLVAHNLIAFFILRPQLLSFMWLALLLVLLELAFRQWDEGRVNIKWLWLCPPLFVLWANSHGAFLAGLGILAVYLSGRVIEAYVQRRELRTRIALSLGGVGLVSVLATLLNPYGADLLTWLAWSLAEPRPEITEWLPPSPSQPVFLPLVLLVSVMVAVLAATRERRDWTQIAILAAVGVQAFLHLRHISVLALLCGFWLPVHLQSAASRLRPQAGRLSHVHFGRKWSVALSVALAATILLQSIGLVSRFWSLPVPHDRYPVDALQFMADQGLSGRLVASFNWSQYAIAALAPDVQVAFDGRFDTCYPRDVIDMHFDFLIGENEGRRQRSPASGPIDSRRVLEHGEPNLVLVDRGYPEAERVMKDEQLRADCDWTLLYQDATAQLWGRAGMYDDPSSADFLPPDQRVISDTRHSAWRPWPALPIRSTPVALATASDGKSAPAEAIQPQFASSHGD